MNNQFSTTLGILITSSLLALLACNTPKTITSTYPNIPPTTYKELIRKINTHKTIINWFASKGQFSIDYPNGQSESFTGNIRIKTDSIIWMQFEKIEVEGARILINPDSIWIINRIDKSYHELNWQQLTSSLHFPTNYPLLQDLLVGNINIPDQAKNIKAITDSTGYQLQFDINRQFNIQYTIHPETYKPLQITINDQQNQQTATMKYNTYRAADGGSGIYIATEQSLTFGNQTDGYVSIQISLNKVEVNTPKKILFSIPPTYELKPL
jgi:hypothetical protein